MNKKTITIIIFLLLTLSGWWMWFQTTPVNDPLSLPNFKKFTFVSESCSTETGEEICRVVSQDEERFLSFKLEGRYKDLIKPDFEAGLKGDCLIALRFTDQRQVDYSCLEYFSELKK